VLLVALLPALALAQAPAERYLAAIELHTVAELSEAMQRAEHLHLEARADGRELEPIAFILHGPEVLALLSPAYESNKNMVNLAARLSAFKYIDLKVCLTWLGGEGIDPTELPPFIGTVPLGATEIQRLMADEGYIYF
jgi:intracellular sulfur oxidation DsrE/DsrF family protein